MSDEMRLGNEDAAWPANGLDTSEVRRMALALQGEAVPALGSPLSKERWGAYAEVEARLSVEVPLPRMSLKELLAMKPGTLLRSDWQISQDVSLRVGDVFLAFVSCEPAGDRLGVRINGFDQTAGAL
ncbi:Type III flagellar switch regulator (C-ring) FliN C-term [Granulicella pectinivorans]|jgi:flagellar motor switch/type III secretory pathway protein FliN|uniref:Type III flagellar switch regulator (C-ring) FliN C-term n=1 Tax=Granulicella pectinivorans TaxID=474950 RepID=A0A1I6M0E2_9BACT|nr:FliM/FliN family flagellar motor C-terminal domain-containing protein [Granulicella pectinivorans]SFS09104.1 Type III flagellar switch regulator (C-ring) FliN C-term [Granulicella pectinivorans]